MSGSSALGGVLPPQARNLLQALPYSQAELPTKLDTMRKAFDNAGATAPDVPHQIWNEARLGTRSALTASGNPANTAPGKP